MICISINQESRRLALADMLNAARQCDLLELRLDRFGKAPDLGELFAHKPKPVIMSCRRTRDGGHWDGTEEERLAILRQCIVSKAEYVEIELDIADQVRPFPPSQRVISYTNLKETPADIVEIYEEAKSKKPDVIKLVTQARTPEEAWPLVQILARAVVPTVVVGLGKPGIMLTLLGKKMGAPWAYAALERGMEAYPGQPTIKDLHSIYHLQSIAKGTRFLGVTGFGERELLTVAALNAAMVHSDIPFRCLPMGLGSIRLFGKVIDAVKLGAAIIDPEHQASILELAPILHGPAKSAQAADLLLRKGDAWHAFHTAAPTWIAALEDSLKSKSGAANGLKDRMVMIVGLDSRTRILAREVQKLGGNAIVASHRKKAGLAMAQAVGCRAIQFEAIYSTMHDCLVVCDQEIDDGQANKVGTGVHAGYLKPGMTVMDLTASLTGSALLEEAKGRGCHIIEPRELLLLQLQQQAKVLTGNPVPADVLAKAFPEVATQD